MPAPTKADDWFRATAVVVCARDTMSGSPEMTSRCDGSGLADSVAMDSLLPSSNALLPRRCTAVAAAAACSGDGSVTRSASAVHSTCSSMASATRLKVARSARAIGVPRPGRSGSHGRSRLATSPVLVTASGSAEPGARSKMPATLA